MQTTLKYLELKSGFSHDGPAWIGLVSLSKSGKTLYFDDKAFQSLKGSGIDSNYFELETGDEYWISGVKRDMNDRHALGRGKIQVEKRILQEYLEIVGKSVLPKFGYELVEVEIQKPIDRINQLENERLQLLS